MGYHNRHRKDLPYRYYPDLLEMAADVDTMAVLVPDNPQTNHLVDAGVLRALGPDGVLGNVDRGPVVDEPALIAALRDGTILSAGLDVYEDEPHLPQELRNLFKCGAVAARGLRAPADAGPGPRRLSCPLGDSRQNNLGF